MEITPDQLCALRLRAQCLNPTSALAALVDVARAVCGVNAQFTPAMLLSLRARIDGLTMGDVQAAIAGRELVRTWTVRGTLHLLKADDLHWFVSLLGPVLAARGERRRAQLGLDDEKCERALQEIRSILAPSEPLTRWELVDRLNERGLGIERRGQAAIHLISLAAFKDIVCLGSDRPNGDKTYALTRRWIAPHEPTLRATGLAELVRRYLAGYGPATFRDFARWSSLPFGEARIAWESLRSGNELTEVQVEGQSLYALASAGDIPPEPSEPTVRLLPAFDTYLLGYGDRRYLVPPEYHGAVYHGGQTVPVVLVNGSAAGTWSYERTKKGVEISVRGFRPFPRNIKPLVEQEVQDVQRFMA